MSDLEPGRAQKVGASTSNITKERPMGLDPDRWRPARAV